MSQGFDLDASLEGSTMDMVEGEGAMEARGERMQALAELGNELCGGVL